MMATLAFNELSMKVERHVLKKIALCEIIRPNLEAVLKQGMLRIFQHGLIRLGTPLF